VPPSDGEYVSFTGVILIVTLFSLAANVVQMGYIAFASRSNAFREERYKAKHKA
jgi:hypothetical protein